MKFTTKPLTLQQRIECNSIKAEYNPINKTVDFSEIFKGQILYLKYGLDELNGIKITEDNFDIEVMKLSNEEITEISNVISDETNFPKKK